MLSQSPPKRNQAQKAAPEPSRLSTPHHETKVATIHIITVAIPITPILNSVSFRLSYHTNVQSILHRPVANVQYVSSPP